VVTTNVYMYTACISAGGVSHYMERGCSFAPPLTICARKAESMNAPEHVRTVSC